MGKRTPGKWVACDNELYASKVAASPITAFRGTHYQAIYDAAYAAAAVRAHDDLCDGLREALDALTTLCDKIDDAGPCLDDGRRGACPVCTAKDAAREVLSLADYATLAWQSTHPGEAFEYEVTK